MYVCHLLILGRWPYVNKLFANVIVIGLMANVVINGNEHKNYSILLSIARFAQKR
jgi:hypothetical protein